MYDVDVTDRSELEALRTRVANQAASLSETVKEGFDERAIESPMTSYRVLQNAAAAPADAAEDTPAERAA